MTNNYEHLLVKARTENTYSQQTSVASAVVPKRKINLFSFQVNSIIIWVFKIVL
jgi:hypothetical protein